MESTISFTEPGCCPHFEGRRCAGCEYASDPTQFDPCCLYGHPEALKRARENFLRKYNPKC